MLSYLAMLGLSLAWFLVFGYGGPRLLALAKRCTPRRQIALWLSVLYSLVVSVLTALAALIVLSIKAWDSLHSVTPGRSNLWFVVLLSLLPWITLGTLASIAAALLTRFEPAVIAARNVGNVLQNKSGNSSRFMDLEVQQLDTAIPLALVADYGRKPVLLISTGAESLLSAKEREAVLWHEYAHAVYQHNGIKRVAATAEALAPKVPLTHKILGVVQSLCEEWADEYALGKVSSAELATARTKLKF